MCVPDGWRLVPTCPYKDDDVLAEQWGRGFRGESARKALRGSPAERAWLEGRLAACATPPECCCARKDKRTSSGMTWFCEVGSGPVREMRVSDDGMTLWVASGEKFYRIDRDGNAIECDGLGQ